MRLSFILLTAFFISCSEISHNSAEWQIETYSSAAPSYIGDFATVIGGNGEILREGTNGWICHKAIQDLIQRTDGSLRMTPCQHVTMKKE